MSVAPATAPSAGIAPRDGLRRSVVELEVIIPALNESKRLPGTLDTTLEYLRQVPWSSRVVVVDNGSVDGTPDVVARVAARTAHDPAAPEVRVLGCRRRGKGSAVTRGMSTSSATFVGFMDADLATPVETLDLVVPLLEAGYDAVIGSRYTPDSRLVLPQPRLRRVGGNVFRSVAKTVLPDVSDTQCGFKFFRRSSVAALLPSLSVDGFAFDLELLARLRRHGGTIVEVPVHWHDRAGSTFSPLRHGVRTFLEMGRAHLALRKPIEGAADPLFGHDDAGAAA
ncbi:MAG: dolichyl-phosphate beta-glucosyltransferase [Actinomycetes bacterium]